jgi:polysaccharide transporter, PST family
MQASMIKNILGLYGVQALNMILPLLSLPVMFRALGQEGFGKVAFAMALSMLWVMWVDSGVAPSAGRLISALPRNHKILRVHPLLFFCEREVRIFRACQQLRSIFAISLMTIVLVVVYLIDSESKNLFIIGFLNIFGTLLLPTYWFTAKERGDQLAMLHLAGRLTSVAGIILFVKTPSDAPLAMFLTSSATLVSGLLAHYWFWRCGQLPLERYCKSDSRARKVLIARTSHLFVTQAIQAVFVNLPVILLGSIHGKVEAGLFSSVEKVGRSLASLLEPLNTAFSPRLAYLHKYSLNLAKKRASQAFYTSFTIGCLVVVVVLLFATKIGDFLFGKHDETQIILLTWFAMWALLHILYRALETNHLLSFGRMGEHKRISTLVLSMQGITICFGALFGAISAILVMLTVESVALLVLARIVLKRGDFE